MKLTKNFTLEEFNCNDGTPVPVELYDNVQLLAKQLQVIRDEIKQPLKILSGYRSPAWNKKVGGKPKSYHMKAMAADLTVKDMRPADLRKVILRLIREKKIIDGGVGAYPGFTHYDVGPSRRW